MKKLSVFLTLMLVAAVSAFAQNITVKGAITDAQTGEAIPGASVLLKGTFNGTVTDINGNYSISVPADAVLEVSFIGYENVSVDVNGKAAINVAINPSVEYLNEVVVTAMGISHEKKALGYAVQDVKADELTQAAASSLSGAIQGKVAGLEVSSSSGMPGASAKITIRGSRSFDGDNSPLYVIDGMPVASTPDLDTGDSVTGSDYSGRAIDIDPNDIESVNVLKGQAASALYGMRASNGVIIITTKKGSSAAKGKPQVTFTSNFSFDKVSTLPEFQTKYAQGSGGVYYPTASTSWGPLISDLSKDATYGGDTVNDYTAAYGMHPGQYYVPQRAKAGLDPWVTPQAYNNAKDFFQTGSTWSNNVSVAKNGDAGSVIFSLGNSNSTGIISGTGLQRYNARMAADTKLGDHFKLGFTGSFVTSNIDKTSSANDGVVATVYGSPASYDLKGIPSHAEGDPYTQVNYRGTSGFDSAYWSLENNRHNEKNQRFFGNAYLQFTTDFDSNGKHNLDVKYQLGEDAYTTNYNDTWGYGHANGKGEIEEQNYTSSETNSLLTAVWNWKINHNWNFSALYGNEIVYTYNHYNYAYGQNFTFSGWNHLNNCSSYVSSSSSRKNYTIGNFLNLSASFANMLFLNATGRVDRVSSMPRNNRTFFYPSFSAGFIFTELDALKNNVLTFGKVRASYAEVGQAGTYVESYYTTPSYGGGFSSGTPVMFPLNGVKAYAPYSVLYDPNLKPQNTKSYELGLDLAFFEGRISLNYTYSRQNVKDQIFAAPIASSTGYSSMVTNGGRIHTNAHEITLNTIPVQTKDFTWEIGANFSKIDNYVDELAEGVSSIFLGGFTDPQVRAGIGDKYPVIYGTAFLRNEDGAIIVDEDGYPMTGEDAVIGSVSPDFRLGLNTAITWKKLRVSAVFDWKKGGDMYCGTYGVLDYYGVTQRSADLRDSDGIIFGKTEGWKSVKIVGKNSDGSNIYAENDIVIPASEALDYLTVLSDVSEGSVYEMSYFKIRELAASYPIVDRKAFKINLNVFARNLLLWTSLKGYDPESSQGNNNMSGGFERFSLPACSSFGAGLTFKF